jgi:alcohol dehydrogenase (cytochrome c)
MRLTIALVAAWLVQAQIGKIDEGRTLFGRNCAFCHGSDAKGGERGPDITQNNLESRDDLPRLIANGLPGRGMPATRLPNPQLESLVAYLRTLAAHAAAAGVPARGSSRGPTAAELAAPPEGSWPHYNGLPGGNRYSSLRQINLQNVRELRIQWLFPIPGSSRLEVTPIVFDGMMFVTGPNEVFALDAETGRENWHFRRARTSGLAGDAAAGINRGVAILGDRVFLATDNAHLIALDRRSGSILWETEMADAKQNYGATSAPLVSGDLVISGISGGDEGVRGFVAAYSAADGKQVWRFWTIPKPGEPLSETWQGKALEHGCASTWLTGTYDPELDLVFWPTGNPCPDYNGDERRGDNLYSDSVLALERSSGRLRWYFQFTPHDLFDWDAQQTPTVIDAEWRGKPHKLLVQANRNGFFYVLDRTDGKLLLAEPFVGKLNWATKIDSAGRPVLIPGVEPTAAGTKVCPAVEGASNWMSVAYHPGTGLYYVMALEACDIIRKSAAVWQPGQSYYGGDAKKAPGETRRKVLRAIELQTGRTAWELPMNGPARTWGGALATAGGLVFFGHDDGDFAAVDARTGAPLWSFPANQVWKSSPMTYMAGGRQLIATAAGTSIIAFALPARSGQGP